MVTLYRTIYTFHIPAFIFVSGYFAYSKPDGRLVRTILLPYLIFQSLYLILDAYYVQQTGVINWQYGLPYWLMWYLVSYFTYSLITPLIDYKSKKSRGVCFLIVLVISLLCGYDSSVGYYFSIARTCCFLPFWVAGYYLGHDSGVDVGRKKSTRDYLLTVICVVFIAGSIYFALSKDLTATMLYGVFSYEAGEYTPAIRLCVHVMGAAWIYLLIKWMPDIKIPVLTVCGRNTLAIYLCHGFIVKYITVDRRERLDLPLVPKLLVMSGVALLIIVTFGNRYFGRVFRKVVTLDGGRNKKGTLGNNDKV